MSMSRPPHRSVFREQMVELIGSGRSPEERLPPGRGDRVGNGCYAAS